MFEDHDNLTIIAADGRYTKPAEATGGRIQIDSGQRFDYLLTTKSEEELRKLNKTNFWIQLESRYRPVNLTSYAILSYEDCETPTQPIPSSPPAETPLLITNDIQDWMEYTLQPIKPNNFPSLDQVSRTVIMASAQRQFVNTIEWTINNRSWTEVDEHLGDTSVNDTSFDTGTPYLVSIYENGNAAVPEFSQIKDNNGYDPDLNVFAAEVGEIIDIVIENQPNNKSGGFDIHSWHIHGGHIYDLGSGPGSYDAVENEKRFKTYNPVMRDTTMLYKYTTTDGVNTLPAFTSQGWRAWRLRVDDAG